MTVFTVGLPPNKTFAVRSATLVRQRLEPFLGVVEVREARRAGGVVRSSRYAVRELPLPDSAERRFRFVKPGGAEFHHALLSPAGDRCECPAALAGRPCKHLLALRALASAGALDHQPTELQCFRS